MNKLKEIRKALLNVQETAYQHRMFLETVERGGVPVIIRGNIDEPKFLFIGEAPGFDEEQIGLPFVGRSGVVLQGWLNSQSIWDYAIINTFPLVPTTKHGKIRKPTHKEKMDFKDVINKLILELNPQFIVLLGRSAEFYSNQSDPMEVGEWKQNIGFIFHPAYYIRNGKDGINDFQYLIGNLIK